MKKVGTLALGLVLVTTTLALAAGPIPIPECIRVEGVITAIDPGAQQITVAGVTVQVTADTIIKMRGQVQTFDYLQVGMTVAACGLMDEDVLVARRVTVKYGGK